MSDFIRVYKFCGRKYGLDNLAKKRLKISTLDDLNDPFEFRGFSLPSRNSREIWEKSRQAVFSNKGIICFSMSWSNPVLWSHYAESHRGLALGFDIPRSQTLPVTYRKTRRIFPDPSSITTQSLMGLIQTSLATKYKHWEYENEVRVFANTDKLCADTGLYFKSFDRDLLLKEIIIGPESSISSVEIRDTADIGDAKIITSRLAFKTYKVTRQMSKDLQK